MIQERSTTSTQSRTDDDREFAVSLNTQVWSVIKRTFVSYWRNPDYVVGKVFLHIVTGLFNSFTFYRLGNEIVDLQSRLFRFVLFKSSPPFPSEILCREKTCDKFLC